MELIEHQTLSQIRVLPSGQWKIKVVVSRKWHDYYNRQGDQLACNLIITDQQGNRMHVRIPSSIVNAFSNQLCEGHKYEITHFVVTPFTGKYKCLKDNKHIVLLPTTTVTEIPETCIISPEDFFDFTHLSTINEDQFHDSHCIDVVGIIRSRADLKTFQNKFNVQQSYLDLLISDTITEVKVRFWDDFAVSCNVALINAALQPLQPIIIIISSCKMILQQHRCEVTLCDGPSTRIFTNHSHGAVQSLRNRFWGFDGFYE